MKGRARKHPRGNRREPTDAQTKTTPGSSAVTIVPGSDPDGDTPGILPIRDLLGAQPLLDEGEIGVGGSATVRQVYDPFLRRRLAMKVLATPAARRLEALQSFVQEAEITAQLEHPNIIPVHDLVIGPGSTSYFTMRLVRGQTLSELLTKTPALLDESEGIVQIVNIFLRVCDAVAFAHSRGVIHGDIKPENIMVGSYGEVYLMDWGVSRLSRSEVSPGEDFVSTSANRSTSRQVHGTPAYMSPEQATGSHLGTTEATDVFGLGTVLYFLLTGRPPFETTSLADSMALAREVRFADPEESPRGQSLPALCRIVRKAMAAEPGQRYASVLELQRETRLFLHGGSHFPSRRFGAGSVIVRQGDPGDEAFIIVSGHCVVAKTLDGQRHELRRLGPGSVFGETAIFSGQARTATVEAIDDVTVRIVTRALIDEQLGMNTWLGRFVLALAERFRETDEKLTQLTRGKAAAPP